MKSVMIDSGHYPNHPNKGQTGYWEYQGVWKISNYLKEILEKQGIQADLTKTYEETFNNDKDLTIRGKKAQNYDLFISEHSNAYNQQTRGVEVFYDFSKPQDKVYAEELALAVAKVMGNSSRGAKIRTYEASGKTYNYYGVIRGASATNCPHIFLIENGFHDNLIDEAFLKIDDNLMKIAQAQANVICKILGVEYKEHSSTLLYRVQVGVFSNKDNADRLLKELQSKGYSPIIKEDNGEVIDVEIITEQIKEQITKQIEQECELKYQQKFNDYKKSLIAYVEKSEVE